MIRPEDQARWAPWLLSGERLLWTGRPKRGLTFRWADLYLVPSGLAGIAFFLVMELGFLGDEAPDLGWFWIAPLILLILYIFPGRFLFDAFLRSRFHYAVTNRRILVLRSAPFADLRSTDLDYLPMLELHDGGRRGTILFDSGAESELRGDASDPHFLGLRGVQFYRIDRPRIVYDLVSREVERRRRETGVGTAPHRDFIG